MDSEDFFIIESGVFRNAEEAFEQAVKDAAKNDGNGGTSALAEKSNCVVIEAPKGKDPLAFAKERAARHGADFWNFVDGPAACVEIKGEWLKANRPKNGQNTQRIQDVCLFWPNLCKGGINIFFWITRKKTDFP